MSSTIRKIKAGKKRTYKKNPLKNPVRKIRFLFLALGLIFIILGVYISPKKSGLPSNEEIVAPIKTESTSFQDEPLKIDSTFLNTTVRRRIALRPPEKVIIPRIGIDVDIQQAKIINGYWEVFGEKAGWGEGSAYPEEVGNTVVFAHAKEGLFENLKNIKTGDRIYIKVKEDLFEYSVEGIKEVYPSQTEVVGPTESSTLTLYTCSGYQDEMRLIVKALKVSGQ